MNVRRKRKIAGLGPGDDRHLSVFKSHRQIGPTSGRSRNRVENPVGIRTPHVSPYLCFRVPSFHPDDGGGGVRVDPGQDRVSRDVYGEGVIRARLEIRSRRYTQGGVAKGHPAFTGQGRYECPNLITTWS